MTRLAFEHKRRKFHGPAKDAETQFAHLDRSACRHSEIARNMVNAWYRDFADACDSPRKSKAQLNYLQDTKRANPFNEALLEIISFQLLSGTGFDVSVDPAFDEEGRLSPDFLLQADSRDFLVECTVRRAQEQPSTSRKSAQLWDWINEEVDPHGYRLFISRVTYGTDNPRRRNLKRALERKTEQLDSQGEEAYYGFEYREDAGFELELSLHRANRMKDDGDHHPRAIGKYPTVFTWGDGSPLLEDAVSDKAHRYRELNKPLIVVLGSGGIHAHQGAASLLHGMLGRNAYDKSGSRHISLLAADLNRSGDDRRAKAAFGFLTEPRNRNISAVLYKPDFGLWSIGKTDWLLLHNPFALTGYESPRGLFPFAHEIWFDSSYRAELTAAKQSDLDILNLPEGWPTSVECDCDPYSREEIDAAAARLMDEFLGRNEEGR